MLTVAPDTILTVGSEATITVSGSSHAGQTITVNIDDGEGHTDTVDIELDDAGQGSATWTVPDWALAKFNYSTCHEVARGIETEPGGDGTAGGSNITTSESRDR